MKRFMITTPKSLLTAATITLLSLFLALGSSPAQAGSAAINSLNVDQTADGESLVFSIDGYTKPVIEVLSDIGAIEVTFTGAEIADAFLVPDLGSTDVITKINYKLGLSEDRKQVTFTFYVSDLVSLNKNSYRLEEKNGKATIVILSEPAKSEPMDLLAPSVKPAEPKKTPYLTEIVSIDIGTHPGGEKVTMRTSNPTIPVLKEFKFPNRVVVEIEGGYLIDELVDRFLYEDDNGLIQKVDLFVAPIEETGLFQMIVTAPQMGYYEFRNPDETTYEFLIYESPERAPQVAKPEPIVAIPKAETISMVDDEVEEALPVLVEEEEAIEVIEETPYHEVAAADDYAEAVPVDVEEEQIKDVEKAIEPAEPKETIVVEEPVTGDAVETISAEGIEDEEEYEETPLYETREEIITSPDQRLPAPASDSVGYSLGYGDTEPLIDDEPMTRISGIDEEIEYPDLPIDDPTATWDFPELEKPVDPRHISDAIVSLNFVNAQFIDVMMILAQQA